jgi:hypothetical protein
MLINMHGQCHNECVVVVSFRLAKNKSGPGTVHYSEDP